MNCLVDSEIAELNEAKARASLKSRFQLFSQPLPSESELFGMWRDVEEVVASIACATFEHGDFLEDAIKSFLLQKTSFRFEIVIRDDASSDGTRDVITRYVKQYPRIVRAQIYDENQFKRGKRPTDDWLNLTQGKYIALCEGDDFWVDRNKLQDQVTQLERHPDCVVSVAGTFFYRVQEDDLQEGGLVEEERVYAKSTPQYHHTSSLVIDRDAFDIVAAKQKKYSLYGDTALRCLLLDEGKCICLPRLVSVYWIDGSGIWTSLSNGQQAKQNVVIFTRIIRALRYSSKLSVLPYFFNACAGYFSTALRNKEWLLAAACCAPYLVVKARDLSRQVVHRFSRFSLGREV